MSERYGKIGKSCYKAFRCDIMKHTLLYTLFYAKFHLGAHCSSVGFCFVHCQIHIRLWSSESTKKKRNKFVYTLSTSIRTTVVCVTLKRQRSQHASTSPCALTPSSASSIRRDATKQFGNYKTTLPRLVMNVGTHLRPPPNNTIPHGYILAFAPFAHACQISLTQIWHPNHHHHPH